MSRLTPPPERRLSGVEESQPLKAFRGSRNFGLPIVRGGVRRLGSSASTFRKVDAWRSIPWGPGQDSNRQRMLGLRLRREGLITSGFFLATSNSLQAVFGFLFWLLAARLFSAREVGLASALVAATAVLSYVGQCGFDVTFVALLPASKDRSALINIGLLSVCAVSMVAAAVYAVAAPVFTPSLDFIRTNYLYFIAFLIVTTLIAVNGVTDGALVSFRLSRYNALIDGLIQGGTKVIGLSLVVGWGVMGIFSAYGIAALLAVSASIALMSRRLSYTPALPTSLRPLATALRYSGLSYVANLINHAPLFLVPLFILRGSGPVAAATFFVALQIANVLYGILTALGQSLLAEGSQPEANIRPLGKGSAIAFSAIAFPAAMGLALLAGPVLSLFGGTYETEGRTLLVVLAVGSIAVALNIWSSTLLKLRYQLKPLIATNVVYTLSVCILAMLWRSHSLTWIGLAWISGYLAAGIANSAVLIRVSRTGGDDRRLVMP